MLPLSLQLRPPGDRRGAGGALLRQARAAARATRATCCSERGDGWPIEVKVPDIGDFKDVPVITVFVKPGDTVAKDDPLVELESDKATMEVPSPAAGKVAAVAVKEGDRVAEGTVILTLEGEGAAAAPSRRSRPRPAPAPRPSAAPTGDIHAEVVVLGSGPGGYTAAFRAADLGQEGGADRARPDARRRLPERRLHPVEGAAARGQGHLRGRGDGALRGEVRQAGGRHRRPARLEGERGQEADRRPLRARQGAQGHGGRGRRHLHRAERDPGRGHGRREDRQLRPVHHRGRVGAGEAAVHPGRPAGDRLDRGAGAAGGAEAAAGDRRRHHRAGDGDGLRRARDQGDDRRVDGPDHPRAPTPTW